VEENSDLRGELEILRSTLLDHSDIVFDHKQGLYKTAGAASIEEKLLLLADGTLPQDELASVQQLIATDSTVADVWAQLKKTILAPEPEIVFENKSILYRTAPTRVILIRWWRVAAAAVLIGFGIWAGMDIYSNSNKPVVKATEMASNKKTTTEPTLPDNRNTETKTLPVQQTASTSENGSFTQNSQQRDQVQKSNPVDNNPANINKQKQSLTVQNDLQQKDALNTVIKPSNNLPKPINPDYELINKLERNKSIAGNVQMKTSAENMAGTNTNELMINKAENATASMLNSRNSNASVATENNARTAVYNGNPEDNIASNLLYMEENNTKHSKLGGLFRKVKRVIERNTNIKTGDGLKLAGFEIAIK
jgi:hypothetical protein